MCDWLREPDLNQRPSGYEPDELPSCSIPRQLKRKKDLKILVDGVEGFEPPNIGTKNRGLTAWRYPNLHKSNCLCGRHYTPKRHTCQDPFVKKS